MTNKQTIDGIMDAVLTSQDSAFRRGDGMDGYEESVAADQHVRDMIASALASKDAAMAVIEAESAAMADALKRIAEAMGLGIGHTAEEIVAAVVALQPIKASPAQGEWIEWKGGRCPIANGVLHQIRMRDGYLSGDDFEAWSWIGWGHTAGENDIVAYRVLA